MTAPVIETWWYAGRRLDTKGKLVYQWRDASGEDHLYAKLRASSPGRAYTLEATRDGDSLLVAPSSLTYQHDVDPHPDAAAWQAADRVTVVQQDRDRLERAEKGAELDEALVPLLAVAKKLRPGPQRLAFASVVLERLQQGW